MSIVTPLEPGQIATPAGADKLRGELLSAHTVRCATFWEASATVYSDGAAEITVSIRFNPAQRTWAAHEYYYSFEKATRALVQFEASGKLPTEDELE